MIGYHSIKFTVHSYMCCDQGGCDKDLHSASLLFLGNTLMTRSYSPTYTPVGPMNVYSQIQWDRLCGFCLCLISIDV